MKVDYDAPASDQEFLSVALHGSDSNDRPTGNNLTAFLEKRKTAGGDGTVEVGVLSGLGMTLDKHDDLGGTSVFPGRIEFEGMEVVAIHAGAGAETISVGGDNG